MGTRTVFNAIQAEMGLETPRVVARLIDPYLNRI